MLSELFPRSHDKYSSLPLLGATLDDFIGWLLRRGYRRYRVVQFLRSARRIDWMLWQRGIRAIRAITREALRACGLPPGRSQEAPTRAATARLLELYLEGVGVLKVVPTAPRTASERLLAEYRSFLEDVRGFARSTVGEHVRTAGQMLEHLDYERRPSSLAKLVAGDIEAFVRIRGQRISRASLQHEIAHLRSFLRFLAIRGKTPPGLETQIDTPRVYRLEQLPRALPWETVQCFLRSIDRSTPRGLRDYAIFLLIATYGLRACEIVTLTLDDVEWRDKRLYVRPSKRPTPLILPLTDAVAAALIDYLRRGRPDLPHRELFLRTCCPGGVLGATAVAESYRAWSSRGGLSIPYHGPHCLRHSYAVHLLRQGTSLKTIGDLLGHRSAESTCVYLRLAIEDLRDVALPLPKDCAREVPS